MSDKINKPFQISALSPNFQGFNSPGLGNFSLNQNTSPFGGGVSGLDSASLNLNRENYPSIFGSQSLASPPAQSSQKSNDPSAQAMIGLASGFGGVLQGLMGRGKRRRAQQAAQDEYNSMLSRYRSLDTSNLYADVENQYANMENTMEDLTVNQQQAQFEAQQGMQQRANIMSGLQGAAGSSGIAGLAQALADQGQLATQRASASIGQQESRNQILAAQQAARIQQMERAGAAQAERLRLAGEERARSLDYQKTSTELGMAQQNLAARNQAIAQADAALYGGIGSIVGTVAGAGIGG